MKKSNKEILIIDDSVTNVFLIESVLSEYGFKVISALGAKEGMKLIEKRIPDLILLDLLMPQISGFDFIKSIKNIPKYQNIPVIVVSALTDAADISEIMRLGASDFIEKPIVLTTLIEKIETFFALA